jgi:uncharacterized protein
MWQRRNITFHRTMKLLPDAGTGYTIHSYGDDWVSINGERHRQSLILSASHGPQVWNCLHFDALTEEHFAQLALLKPEMVVFGSGKRLRFPKPQWLQSLYAQRIGVETMDTQAACRTFNFLVGEGRVVVAALLLESDKP